MLDPEFDENKEDIQSSVQRYEKMINQQENAFFDAETLEQIAEHYFVQSRFDQALEAVDLGLSHYSYSLELITLKAQILGEMQKPEEAMELIENAILLFPNDIELTLVKGYLLSQMGQHEESIQLFLASLDRTEEKDEVYFRLGLSYLAWSKPREAVDMFKKSLEHNPENEWVVLTFAIQNNIKKQNN